MSNCSNCGEALQTGAKFCPSCGTRAVVAEASGDALLGRTLNEKYRIVSTLGSGSMGTVYLAEHIGLHKKVALKVLRPDLEVSEETLQRFQREGIAAGKFSHPNAIQIFDFDRAGDRLFYLAMEFVEGANLKQFLAAEGRVSLEDALDITSQVLAALGEAHRRGIVHRDLKPENIMVQRDAAGEPVVKVLDFGLSKLVNVPLGASMATQPGRIMGTPMYMAPEQGSGEGVDHRSDLYAVGLILYELVSGEPPFKGESLTELFVKQATQPVPSVIDSHPDLAVPDAVDEVLERALAKQKDERFQTAEEMLEALHDVDPEAPAARPRRPSAARRRPAAVAPRRTGAQGARGRSQRGRGAPAERSKLLLVVAAVAIALGAGGWFLLRGTGAAAAADVPRVSMKSADARTEQEARYVSLLDGARARLRAGDLEQAMGRVEDAHGIPCRDSEAFLVRAQVYRARDDDDTARADLREALRIDPNFAEAAAALGWIELDRGDLDGATARFDEALGLDNACPEGIAGRGAVLWLRGDAEAARPLLARANDLDPDSPTAAYYLGRALLAAGDADGAVEALIRAKRSDPGSAPVYAALGEAYLARGQRSDAEKQLREAITLDGDARAALAALAALLGEAGRQAEVVELLEDPVRRHPGWSRESTLLGAALDASGRREEAIAALERAVAADAASVVARTLLGITYQREGRLGEAVEQYDAALALDRRNVRCHLNRGVALFQLERFDEAREALEFASELDPQNAYAHYALGLLQMDYLGDAEAAREHFEAYRTLGGDDQRVAGWLRGLGE